MTQKIGVISLKLPASLPAFNTDATIHWFCEIEGALAYLMNDELDKLFFDRELIDLSLGLVDKAQKLIQQMHPKLDIAFLNLEDKKILDLGLNKIHYFPRLETLFKNGELKSVFQPIVDSKKSQPSIYGVECLSRFYFSKQWYAPEFIFNYAAEKLSLTNYDKICLMQSLSLVPHNKKTLIFLNVRPQTLISKDFCIWFKALLKKHHLLAEQIVMEVTEQYCNVSEHEMMAQCINLKNMGIKLAIDDFGCGISNLSMLEVMAPSYLKVSGRFIKGAHKDLTKQKIIKNVLELANDFQIKAILEMVEQKEEWDQVKNLGARFAQGFYFFRPMDKDHLARLFFEKELLTI